MSNCIPEFNPLTDYLDEVVRSPNANTGDTSYLDQVADMVHVPSTPHSDISMERQGGLLWRTCFRK